MSDSMSLLQKIHDMEMELMCLRERVSDLETEVEVLTEKPDPHRELSPVCGFDVTFGDEEFESDETEY